MKTWTPEPLSHRSAVPLHTEIRHAIERAVIDGALPVGNRLPGTRDLAEAFGVHRLTVTKAIRFLENRGILTAVAGKGVFVAKGPKYLEPPRELPPTPFFEGIAEGAIEGIDIPDRSGVLGRFVAQTLQNEHIGFAAGFPPESLIPGGLLKRTASQVMKDPSLGNPFSYAHPEGDPRLIAQIERLLEERGYALGKDDRILITSGAEEAISLSLECFFNRTKGLIIESPGYMGTIAACRQRHIPMCPAPVDHGGVHPGSVERYLKSHEAVGLYTVPTYQNPTGITQQGRRREKLMALSTHYGAVIIEDDTYMDLRFGGRPIAPLKSLDGGENVIYIGSFSKSLAPGLRLGFLVATGDRALMLKHYKETWDISTNSLSQAIVAAFIESGAYRRHLHRVRRIYKERRDAMLAALEAELFGIAEFTKPKGGMHIWVMLQQAVNLTRIEERAGAQGVIFAPSNLFFEDGRKTSAFRLNFTANDTDTIREGISRLAGVIKQEIKK